MILLSTERNKNFVHALCLAIVRAIKLLGVCNNVIPPYQNWCAKCNEKMLYPLPVYPGYLCAWMRSRHIRNRVKWWKCATHEVETGRKEEKAQWNKKVKRGEKKRNELKSIKKERRRNMKSYKNAKQKIQNSSFNHNHRIVCR